MRTKSKVSIGVVKLVSEELKSRATILFKNTPKTDIIPSYWNLIPPTPTHVSDIYFDSFSYFIHDNYHIFFYVEVVLCLYRPDITSNIFLVNIINEKHYDEVKDFLPFLEFQ